MPDVERTSAPWIAVRRVGLGLAIAAGLFAAAVIGSARWGDRSLWPPAAGAPATEVFVVSHGYHAGIIVPVRSLAEQGRQRGLSALGYVATRFAGYDRLEIGWGDEGFYREVPTPDSLTVALALASSTAPPAVRAGSRGMGRVFPVLTAESVWASPTRTGVTGDTSPRAC